VTQIIDIWKNRGNEPKQLFPERVANIVLEAVTTKNSNLRHLAGKDVEQWIEQKKKLSDKEFSKMIK
jgi:hypothetical protein